MTERIEKLIDMTFKGELFPGYGTRIEHDRMDMMLPKIEREAKQLCEYIAAQEPFVTEYNALMGFIRFNATCVGDAFTRVGHKETKEFQQFFYLKSIDNLSTYEAQHAAGDYKKVLKIGLHGIIGEIEKSYELHEEVEERQFLKALKDVSYAIIDWAHRCSASAGELAKTVENKEHRENLEKLSEALLNVPENGATSFYEAVVCMNFCFHFNPDSFGTLDRYLKDFYDNDIKNGIMTREKAKEYLAEFFLAPQNWNIHDTYKSRGGQSHFCVGGYTPDGKDGFFEITRLIIETLMEMPTFIPQITFRWTPETPHEVMRYVMDCERNDKNKRIAFANDGKRVKALVDICGIPFEKVVEYTLVGCNEICFPGGIIASTSKGNVLRCIETLFHKKPQTICGTKDFDEFYAVFEKELCADLDLIYEYDDKYNLVRARDINYLSCFLFNGCIENAKSFTQGGAEVAVSSVMMLGVMNVIDSLTVVKQFVFEEKLLTMEELCKALAANWEGFEDIRATILKKGRFFGNNDELSNEVAQRFYETLYNYCYGKRNVFGYPLLIGDHTGYNPHFEWIGSSMAATPDGRMAGQPVRYGLYQSADKDRDGLTSLLASVAAADKYGINTGSTVTNISLEETLVRNDESFEKLVYLFEAYFKAGGTHFQLNYVSREELIEAKENPEKYANLRVRVTGFSDYFVNLKESIQDSVIERTVKSE